MLPHAGRIAYAKDAKAANTHPLRSNVLLHSVKLYCYSQAKPFTYLEILAGSFPILKGECPKDKGVPTL
jgi:hypothetical protein